MIYLAWFIIAFSVIQLLVALSNLMFQQKMKHSNSNSNSLVSILIPVRNEENNIGKLLNDLQKQDYENIEIIVFDDQSTDNTENIVGNSIANDKRIKLISSKGLPEGWLGKNYGCYNLAKQSKGKYILFLDADVRVKNDIILNSISLADKHSLGLLSIFPKQEMESIGERITVPNMNYILLSLLPIGLVLKSKFTALAAANGQFMLFNSKIYTETNPHEKFKNNRVEDIEIARYYKQKGIAVGCLTGDDSISCRMYSSFGEAVNGFSKNVINFFGNSFVVAILFWIITSFGFIPVLISLENSMLTLYLFTVLTTRIIISVISKQNVLLNCFYIVPQQIALGLIIYKAFENKLKKQHQWKGRNIS
ncbi:MAG: glycosyltransferase [Paludibacter sp.]|nr:glycosyltransferase [Paludibacter sp.]